jgi:hypothetical protein
LNSTEKARIRHQSTKTPNLTKGFGVIWCVGALVGVEFKNNLPIRGLLLILEPDSQKGFYPILINFYLFFEFY